MSPETLLRSYFLNRNNLKVVMNKIKAFHGPGEKGYPDSIDLNPYRESYWAYQDYLARFPGWVYVLEYKTGYSAREMELAKLLDRKRELRKEMSIIKRRMFYAGKKLIKQPAV